MTMSFSPTEESNMDSLIVEEEEVSYVVPEVSI